MLNHGGACTRCGFSLSRQNGVSCFLSCKSQCFCTSSSRLPVFKRAYSREFLLDVGRITFLELNSAHAKELRDLGLLRRPTPSPTPTTAPRPQWRCYKRRERKQKRVSAEVSKLGYEIKFKTSYGLGWIWPIQDIAIRLANSGHVIFSH